MRDKIEPVFAVLQSALATHHDMRDKIEPVFAVLQSVLATHHDMSAISTRTNVPLRTLYSWWKHLQQDPQWRPGNSRFHANS
jgi:hypothetical protein